MKTSAKIILGSILLCAAIAKIQDIAAFEANIKSFQFFHPAIIGTLAHSIPALEALLAVFLFLRETESSALLVTTGLFTGFTLLYAYTLIAGIEPDCGCFGKDSLLNVDPLSGLLRAGLLTILSAAAWLSLEKKQ